MAVVCPICIFDERYKLSCSSPGCLPLTSAVHVPRNSVGAATATMSRNKKVPMADALRRDFIRPPRQSSGNHRRVVVGLDVADEYRLMNQVGRANERASFTWLIAMRLLPQFVPPPSIFYR